MYTEEYRLLATRRYVPLLVTQFTSSLNDHILRNLVLLFVLHHMTHKTFFALAIGAFLIPFLLFSRHAGVLADTSEKSRIISIIKLLELAIALLMAFAVMTENTWLMLATVFAMGCDVAYFLPFKHSILPQLLSADELIGGNAFLNTLLFVAAMLALFALAFWGVYPLVIAMVVVAALGCASSYLIPKAPALTKDRYSYNLFEQDKIIIFCIVCIAWFWFINYIYLKQFFPFAIETLHLKHIPFEIAGAFVLGVAFGSLIINSLLRSDINLRYLPLSLLLIIVASADLYFSSMLKVMIMVLVDLFVLGFACGMFIVPLYATLQHRSAAVFRARNVAHSSMLSVKLIILAYLILLVFDYKHVSVLSSLLIVPVTAVFVLIYVVACKRS